MSCQTHIVRATLVGLLFAQVSRADTIDPAITALVETSCIACHDSSTETSLDFESVGGLADPEAFRMWVKVFDRIQGGTMPPESEERPDPAVLKSATGTLEARLRKFSRSGQDTAGRVPARRLTKREYGYTLQDLLDIEGDVTNHLPDEVESGSFDTVGSTQRLSAIHMDGLLRAADDALGLAISLGPNPYHEQTFDLENNAFLNDFHEKPLELGGNISRRLDEGVALFRDVDYLIQSGILGLQVNAPGTYRIKATLEAFQSKQPVTYKIIVKQPSGGATIVRLGDLLPDNPEAIEVNAYLNPGDNFYVTLESDDSVFIGLATQGAKNYTGSGLAIRSLGVAGPIQQQWPPKSTRELLVGVELVTNEQNGSTIVELSKPRIEHVREIVDEFAERAFRRPVDAAELESFVDLALPGIEEGLSFDEVIRVPLRSVLCSPQFLMHSGQPGQLDPHSLASRLSYFLWKSLPDDELLDAARRGKLTEATELSRQVERMLADDRSQRFVNDFIGQWLRLDRVNATSPDEKLYPEFDEPLGDAIPQETRSFFTTLIRENASLTHLIDADYTFVNRRLAQHYGMQGIEGQHFRKVKLAEGSPRGGVLTQAAILKTTANGTVTSPVTRGNFVLTSLLGTPPSPPPPGVGSIEPDTRGKTTIREILRAHRDNASCNTCHRMIDPPGFALESFDPIGGLRTHYRANGAGEGFFAKVSQATYHNGPRVDSSSVTADGREFSGIKEFKNLLMEQKEQVARNVVSQLIVYSTGGEIEFADRDVIDEILKNTEKGNYPMRDLIHAVVHSRLFREK
ncbi:DUF1592 domain-containing protein [Planctomycetes bacterium TBK1r]|uniref:Planctomycete cytochrome C n=1 Tax=Stieleria magnilauensis TaxID=2527963 RepID=A0ABX5XMH4_9BACT|nr:hypothetical protein TBK1r_10900 [Planctomycetes bacterium TBK1r]